MAEFDRPSANDPAEAAYRDALLGDDTGREQRRARLMAALPRPELSAAVPVSGHAMAWRASPYALGLVLIGLLLAAVLLLKGRGSEVPVAPDPRLAAAQPASAAPVMAQASPAVDEPRLAAAGEAPRMASKAAPAPMRSERAAPVVVADAAPPPPPVRGEPSAAADEPVSAAMAAPPAPAPAPAAAPAAAPAPAPAAAAAPAPAAAPIVAAAPKAAEPLAQAEVVSSSLAARAKVAARAASRAGVDAAADLADSRAVTPADAMLLAAIQRRDLALARSALQAGASVHVRDDQGRTVLMLAARTGARDMVALLLAAGARKADRDPQGWTAADHARDQAHDELFDALR